MNMIVYGDGNGDDGGGGDDDGRGGDFMLFLLCYSVL